MEQGNLLEQEFDPEEFEIQELCDTEGTGIDAITDLNRELFYPILMAIEETVLLYFKENHDLEDSDIIESLKNIRDNCLSKNFKFNILEEKIINKIKIILSLNSYNTRDVRLSISSILKSAKLHRSQGGKRGYLNFITEMFNKLEKLD